MEAMIFAWPGKSPSVNGGAFHPAACHMLDVAAVAELLIPVDEPRRALFTFMVALHDLGKIGAKFRDMILHGKPQGRTHWEVTEAWLLGGGIHARLCAALCGTRHALQPLAAAIAGHHGRPPTADQHRREDMRAAAGPDAARDALAFVETCLGLWPEASLAGLRSGEAKRLSWFLAGLTTVADWVGSNPDWFPVEPAPVSAAAYLEKARLRAAKAVEAAGLIPPAPAGGALFDFAPRPMQAAAASVPLGDGPMLAFIEDETGAGKTEAALLLAQRMLLAGKGRGLYFALPTMATADAMFARAAKVVGRLFASPPSLALAHGRAALSRDWWDVRRGDRAAAEVVCADWLADNRRRALLADVGVGTVDQALLSVLPTKFATLRHWGLSAKLLIVDEAHELGAPYMARQLAQLLRLHAMRGGSAILLTATLPLDQRAALARAFEEGAGRTVEEDRDPAYPALSIPGGAALRAFPQKTGARGPVTVERLDEVEAAVALIVAAAARGAACLWARNAVDDAIGAVEALRAAGVAADLLHARFAFVDRKRIEAAALARFGKGENGGEGDRRGRVLVATQVVESSLDLDFDVMVSDLAPMAGLIQRAGRLWRHMEARPAAGRPVPAPVLHVVSPDPAAVETDRWLHRTQPAGAWVYSLADQWRTADALFARGEIVAPSGLRALIESVHGDGAKPVPPVLEAAEQEAEGRRIAEGLHARQNVIDIDAGYRESAGADDRVYPTRLGRETATLLLTRLEGGELRPWAPAENDEPSALREMLSEVSASAAKLAALPLPDQDAPEIRAFKKDWPEWRRLALTVCPVGEGGAICEGLRYDADLGLMFSSPRMRG